jgi:hypothetical protein
VQLSVLEQRLEQVLLQVALLVQVLLSEQKILEVLELQVAKSQLELQVG